MKYETLYNDFHIEQYKMSEIILWKLKKVLQNYHIEIEFFTCYICFIKDLWIFIFEFWIKWIMETNVH